MQLHIQGRFPALHFLTINIEDECRNLGDVVLVLYCWVVIDVTVVHLYAVQVLKAVQIVALVELGIDVHHSLLLAVKIKG